MASEYYECDGCGACCACPIIEVDVIDVLRLPEIAERCKELNGHGSIPTSTESIWSLACGKEHPCPFLLPDKKCGQYDRRPSACVEFQAGSEKCQSYRRSHSIDALKPVKIVSPTKIDGLRSLLKEEQDGE